MMQPWRGAPSAQEGRLTAGRETGPNGPAPALRPCMLTGYRQPGVRSLGTSTAVDPGGWQLRPPASYSPCIKFSWRWQQPLHGLLQQAPPRAWRGIQFHKSRHITEGIKQFSSAIDTRVMKVNLSHVFPIGRVFTLRQASRQPCFRETGPLGGESWACLPRQVVSVSIHSGILIL